MSNRELPMMPWYPDQFAASTVAWTWLERALYRCLLDAQWQLGALPPDPKRIAIIAGIPEGDFKVAWQTVSAKFVSSRGGLINKRLETHRLAAMDRKQHLSTAGARGGQASAQARVKRGSTDAQASVQATVNPLSPSPSQSKNSEVLTPPSQEPTARARPTRRQNGLESARAREAEPEAMRVAKALTVLKADPECGIGDAARMFNVTVAAIEKAQAALKRAGAA